MPKKKPQAKLENLDVDCIKARSIQLVDEQGKTRASLFTTLGLEKHSSLTVVQIMGDDGLPKLELQVDGNSPGIRLTGANDQIGASLAVNDKSNGISINDREGRPAIQIGIYHQGGTESPLGTKPAVVLTNFSKMSQSPDEASKHCKIIQPGETD